VSFVEDENLEAASDGFDIGGGDDVANLIDTSIGGSVDLDDVHGSNGAFAYLTAGVADATGFGYWTVRGLAIQGHCKDAGDGRFAYAAVAAEDVAMCNSLLLESVLQGPGNVVLTDDIGEALRPVFAREYLVAHGKD
jgi:hypothetical protein